MVFPNKTVTIDVLLTVAAEAAAESSSQHPEDIMIAMVNALEIAAKTIEVIGLKGVVFAE